MTNDERIYKLQVLHEHLLGMTTPAIDRIRSLGGDVDEYILFWPNPEQRAIINNKTGNVVVYYQPDNEGNTYIHHDNSYYHNDNSYIYHQAEDLSQFNDEIDARIDQLGNSDLVNHDIRQYQLQKMSPTQMKDLEFFRKNLEHWLKDVAYKGKHVVISDQKVRGVHDCFSVALSEAAGKYMAGQFIIQEISYENAISPQGKVT